MTDHALARSMIEEMAETHMMSEEDIERILKAWFQFAKDAAKEANASQKKIGYMPVNDFRNIMVDVSRHFRNHLKSPMCEDIDFTLQIRNGILLNQMKFRKMK